jgi:hypothetical protein
MEFLGQRRFEAFFKRAKTLPSQCRKRGKIPMSSQKNMEFWNFHIYLLNNNNNNT